MRMSVVDVGSNTACLVVADVAGGWPVPVHTAKYRLRLGQHLDRGGRLPERQIAQVAEAVGAARAEAERWGTARPLTFATAVVRDAPNRAEVLRAVRSGTGTRLCVLPGELEAELSFLAVRRWMGWQAGPLTLMDLGGGTLEVAFGRGRLPDYAVSLPLGAGRLTREHFTQESRDPPPAEAIRAVRRRVRTQLRDVAARIRQERTHTAVAASRTFQQLARLCGAAPERQGPFVPRQLSRPDLRRAVDRLADLPVDRRASLPGISAARSRQALAGAVVAHATMKLIGVGAATICPWGLREGIMLRHVEDGADWWAAADLGHGAGDAGGRDAPAGRPVRAGE
ncbi:Ppx/GppA phosphatase family protein [Streptomyces sp. NBC_01803]|uniref:Ppx/GppA phosphatase family protein n=1 Tax=Streptomyces sp. NBC_01803 TaxID=2975946 RepID=UPI002DDBE763|nr:Ppx/GppA family phosphatase [Streptomyces sp. NBC_01803]WSA47386.1 Ppx/GppA family phosphatase [Streptomyces sp. NBC_01803]